MNNNCLHSCILVYHWCVFELIINDGLCSTTIVYKRYIYVQICIVIFRTCEIPKNIINFTLVLSSIFVTVFFSCEGNRNKFGRLRFTNISQGRMKFNFAPSTQWYFVYVWCVCLIKKYTPYLTSARGCILFNVPNR